MLYLQVLDYDRFSRNDPIGEVSIPLNKVDLTQMQTFWKDLKPCSDGSVRVPLPPPGDSPRGEATPRPCGVPSSYCPNRDVFCFARRFAIQRRGFSSQIFILRH